MRIMKKECLSLCAAHTSRTLRDPSELWSPVHSRAPKRPPHGRGQLQSDATRILHIRSVFEAPLTGLAQVFGFSFRQICFEKRPKFWHFGVLTFIKILF